MKNKEKYANEIMEIATKGGRIALDETTKTLFPCNLECEYCYFAEKNYPNGSSDCNININHWANSEYVERKEFTEQEKAMVGALDKIKWVATDRNGETYGFINKPYKSTDIWKSDNIMDSIFLSGYSSCKFKAIEWEDDEPTSREEILGEEKK